MTNMQDFGNNTRGGAGSNFVLMVFLVGFSFCAILSAINGYEMKPLKAAWNMFEPKVEQGVVTLSKMKEDMVGKVEKQAEVKGE